MVTTATLTAALLFGEFIEALLLNPNDKNDEYHYRGYILVGEKWRIGSGSLMNDEGDFYGVRFNLEYDKIEKTDGYTLTFELSDIVFEGDCENHYLVLSSFADSNLKIARVSTSNGFEFEAENYLYESLNRPISVVQIPLSILEENLTLEVNFEMMQACECNGTVLVGVPDDTGLDGYVIIMEPECSE
jgi:hypothetical protein